MSDIHVRFLCPIVCPMIPYSKTVKKDSTYVKNFSNTFIKLLENSQFIPRSELTLEWRPLYKMYQRFHHNPKAARYVGKFFHKIPARFKVYSVMRKKNCRNEFLNFLRINFETDHFMRPRSEFYSLKFLDF